MPYREKTAWLSLATMLISFGPYFAIVAAGGPARESAALPSLRLFATAAVAQMILLAAGHLFLKMRWPDDARTPADERDRDIMQRSISSAYYVLIAGMILVGCVMPFSYSGWSIVNAAIAMVVIAEVVHYSVIVVSYRGQT